jgi:hypothetical protein
MTGMVIQRDENPNNKNVCFDRDFGPLDQEYCFRDHYHCSHLPALTRPRWDSRYDRGFGRM